MEFETGLWIAVGVLIVAIFGLSFLGMNIENERDTLKLELEELNKTLQDLNNSIPQQLNESYTLGYYEGIIYWNEKVYNFWYEFDELVYIDYNNDVQTVRLCEVYQCY